MGVWTEVKGKVSALMQNKLSVEKATREFFDGYDVCYQPFIRNFIISTKTADVIETTVDFRFEADGIDACKYVEKYVRSLKEKDKYAMIDLEVTARFLA